MKKVLIILLLTVFILSCVNIDTSPKVNITKTNTSYNLSQKSGINASVNLTQTTNLSNQSTNLSSVTISVNTSVNQNNSSNLTNKTAIYQQGIKTSSDFEIFFPKEGYHAKGDITAVSLKLINFSIGTLGDAEQPNVGLFRYAIDSGAYKIIDKATFTISNLTKGTRKLTIEMIGTNMTNYGVKKSVSFQAQSVTEGY